MKIAVCGATGRIGAKLTRSLLEAGHQVRALSRGGAALDELAKRGAEPFLASFDTGSGDLDGAFQGVDAAFLMVKTDWNNIEGHYPVVAKRFVDALQKSSVGRAVSLSAIGAEISGKTGHFECFHHLEQTLNGLSNMDLVHLRAAWFMENTMAWVSSAAQYGRIAWSYDPDLKMPWVATDDIADLAAVELTRPSSGHRVALEVGSEELSMLEIAKIISEVVGRPIEYRCIDRRRKDVEEVFLSRFGTPAQWQDDSLTADAFNDGVVEFHGNESVRPLMPTTMQGFIEEVWKPRYLAAMSGASMPETFHSWSAR